MASPTTLVANRMPAPTWNRLKMNQAEIAIPAAHEVAQPGAVAFSVPDSVEWFERTIEGGDHTETGNLQIVGRFDRDLEALGAAGQFEDGMGSEAAEWMHNASTRRLTIRVPDGIQVDRPVVVRVKAQDGAAVLASVGVIAGANSHVRVAVHVDAARDGVGVVGSSVRVIANQGAQVGIDVVQTVQGHYKHLDNMGIYQAAGAQVKVNQTVLGAAESYTGLAADLAGDQSCCQVDTRYLGHDDQLLDFNYVMRQRGQSTTCNLYANGVLTDRSRKVLRGTIDLVHGCKGSVGREQETVLLASEDVSNKTIPVILCDEDDVQGDHGATIGHVNPEQLRYMLSRGLRPEQVEDLFAQAVFDHAAGHAFDGDVWEAIGRLGAKVLGRGYRLPGED